MIVIGVIANQTNKIKLLKNLVEEQQNKLPDDRVLYAIRVNMTHLFS